MCSISSYFSIQYLAVLLPVTVILYAVLPQKFRRMILLLASYVFFWAVSGKLIVYLLFSTLSVHHLGMWLSDIQGECDRTLETAPKEQKKEIKKQYLFRQRRVVTFGVLLHIGILLVLKYSPFFAQNLNSLMKLLGLSVSVEIPRFLLPIGISFYTMQAVSYLFDVYRRKIQADRNLFRLALFMAFFPQIMEGPICRYEDTAGQLWAAASLRYQNVVFGLQRILLGVMKKLVVADRLNLMIENIYTNYARYDGLIAALGAVAYTAQLYMDFSGTMDLVIGTGQIFGVKMPENFRRPFFSKTISEFWKRWHITLGTWFKDYIFYPLSMSKPLKKLTTKARKRIGNHYGPLLAGSIALFCVWLCNGLWHGAGWNYIFFGMYHFVLILCGSIIEPTVIRITEKLHIKRSSKPYRLLQIVRTTVLVCIGEMFFRAESLRAGFVMFGKMMTQFRLTALRDGSIFAYGMDPEDFGIVAFTLLLIFIISFTQERGVHIREKIAAKNVVVRFAIWYALILFVVIFGAYGEGYVPVEPIYAEF